MFKVLLSLLKNVLGRLSRHLYWIYKLSQSDIGSDVKLEFPIIREGKGILRIGKRSFIGKKVKLGVGENGNLVFGNGTRIETKTLILVKKNCNLTIGNNFKIGEASRCFIQNDWNFGDNVKIETNCAIFAREPDFSGKLYIGNNSNIGDYTIIDLVNDLTIGNDVAIGPNCTIYTHDHIYTDKSLPAWKGGVISKPIIIEDGAWVGANVTILPGTTIGKRAVVAAGSIVTQNVEANCIYGGNPAKLIKEI